MLNIFFLKTFVDVAKSGSASFAAQKNYVTQPAVTQHLQILESKLDCKLFERHKRKFELTPSGHALLHYAEIILRQFEEAKTRIGEINQRQSFNLRLGTIYSIGLYELQPLVKQFLKKFPETHIHLEYHPFHQIYDLVANRDIDFGFVAFPSAHPKGVSVEIFHKEKLVLIQSPMQRVFGKGSSVTFKDLNKAKFVSFSTDTPTRNAIDAFLRSKQCFPATVHEYDNVETLKSAVTLGIGCSIVPESSIRNELRDRSLEVVPFKPFTLERPLAILHRKGKHLSQTEKIFHKMVLEKINATHDNVSFR